MSGMSGPDAQAITPRQMIEAMKALGYVIGLCQDTAARKAAHLALNDLSGHIDALQDLLTWIDGEFECLGTEGWRHRLGID